MPPSKFNQHLTAGFPVIYIYIYIFFFLPRIGMSVWLCRLPLAGQVGCGLQPDKCQIGDLGQETYCLGPREVLPDYY